MCFFLQSQKTQHTSDIPDQSEERGKSGLSGDPDKRELGRRYRGCNTTLASEAVGKFLKHRILSATLGLSRKRNYFTSNLVINSPKFKKLLTLQVKSYDKLKRSHVKNRYMVQHTAVPQQYEYGIDLEFDSYWRILFPIGQIFCYIHILRTTSQQFNSLN